MYRTWVTMLAPQRMLVENIVQITTGCSTSATVWLNPAKCFPKAKFALKVVQRILFMWLAMIGLPIHITFLVPCKVQLHGFVVVMLHASP